MELFGKKIDGVLVLVGILVVAAITWVLVGKVNTLYSKGENMMNSQTTALDSFQYDAYDNKLVSGDTAISAIKMVETPNPTKVQITVVTKPADGSPATQSSTYGWNAAGTTYTSYAVTDPTADAFINPAQTFKATLTKANGLVTVITFTQL